MTNKLFKLRLSLMMICILCFSSMKAITPNTLLTRGQQAYTTNGTTNYLTDGTLTNWKNSSSTDISIQVNGSASRLFVTWESFGDCAWATDFTAGCSHSGESLKNFEIQTSSNSTDGKDGDWKVAASIEDNPVMSRGVYIDFEGESWIRIVSKEEVGQLLEIEAFDVSNGGDDTWFFMGTSISQMGLKQQETDTTTADLIHSRYPSYTPAMLRGGIGCINSTEVVSHLPQYLKYAGNVHYWAIEMGTNDAWGGGDWNLQTFKNNMQIIIDSCKAHNIEPIIARIIATDATRANWQVNPKFLDAIDELVLNNNLHQGPDFYTYFLEHPELIGSDGVHPNAETKGGQAMHHLWADALAPLYEENRGESLNNDTKLTHYYQPQVKCFDKSIYISRIDPTTETNISILSPSGVVLESWKTKGVESVALNTTISEGFYTIVISSITTNTATKIIMK